MGADSKIEWTDRTWNPTVGCAKVSEGCRNCYAMRVAARMAAIADAKHPDDAPSDRQRAYQQVVSRDCVTRSPLPQWNGRVIPIESALTEPLGWRSPGYVFVDSMSDLFHEDVPDRFIWTVLLVCMAAHGGGSGPTFQILTKRPERAAKLLGVDRDARHYQIQMAARKLNQLCPGTSDRSDIAEVVAYLDDFMWPPPNIWLGTSCENQETANERIPHLLRTPAAVRFLSCEPLLGPIDLDDAFWYQKPTTFRTPNPNWVIVGGESGPNARPMHPDWARGIRDQCAAAGVPFFFKQWGEWVACNISMHTQADHDAGRACIIGLDGRPKESQGIGDAVLSRVGKKAAGRLLDGKLHEEFPK